MCQKWLVLPENCHLSNWSFFSVTEDTKYAVCNSCKQKVSRGGATRTTTVPFPVILFHSKSNQTGIT